MLISFSENENFYRSDRFAERLEKNKVIQLLKGTPKNKINIKDNQKANFFRGIVV